MATSEPSPVFVGRERELDELGRTLQDAIVGRGRLVLIAGEPGIGKTRLADELGHRALAVGARVLWGRCWEGGGAPAFWPWAQVVRATLAHVDGASTCAPDGVGIARIAQIVPELPDRLGAPCDLPEEDPDRARFRLFDAVATFLNDASAASPLVIVLDDLHDADHASLLLLRFVAGQIRTARILLLGIYRLAEARRDERMRAVLGDLARAAREMTLHGFGDSEIGRFIAEATARAPADAVVRTIREATAGNPFFVTEVVRLLSSRYGETRWTEVPPRNLPVPTSVRTTIRRRLETLPGGSRELLAIASFIGREFDLRTLEHASGLDRGAVLERLGEAVADGFTERLPNAVADYRFSHDLVRETFYEDATPAERVRLHLRVGETIEELHRTTLDAHASELAHHFSEAAPAGDAEKALAYSMRAGERADAALAYEEAVNHFEQAKRLIELYDLRDAAFRFDLLLALGEAQKRSGAIEGAKATFRAAADVAETLHSADGLARVALGYPFAFGGFGAAPEPPNELLIGWLRRAQAGVAPEALALRARLLSRLSIELYFSPALSESLAVSAEAVRLAQESEDLSVVTGVLMTRVAVLSGTAPAEESLAAADEVVRIADEIGSKDLSMSARFWRIAALFRIGDRAAIDAEIATQVRLAEALREPRCRWLAAIHQAARDMVSVDSAGAARIAGRTLALGEAAQERMSGNIFGYEMLHPLREQGRLAELMDRFRAHFEESPSIPVFRATLAWLQAELGFEAEARQLLDTVAEHEFADMPRDLGWGSVVTLLAGVSDRLADLPRARVLYDLILPFAAETAVVGPGLAYLGSFAHYLGVLARRLGRWEAARRHFETALDVEARMGASRFVARTEYEYARMLLDGGETGDRERVVELLGRAAETARRLDMKALMDSVETLRSGIEEPRGNEAPRAAEWRAAARNVFRLEGDYWTVGFEGEPVRVRDMKGFRYIAYLLREPGRELHVADLIGLVYGVDPHRPAAGDAGEILDARARTAYQGRLEDLRSELEEAERFNDAGRATRAREEIDRIGAELAAAVGLGGRSRRASSDAERARLMVTQRIRGAIRKIAAARPALGRHLEASIRTGSFCSYIPPSPVSWEL
jgi:tetratricopeptide (TPR) repeat protein